MSFGPDVNEVTLNLKLKGLTWDHPRGYAPLIAGAREYRQSHPGVEISWDRRTLREFGEAPIEQYADRYDLIIIDHPFTGFAAGHDVLVDLAPYITTAERDVFARDSVGLSWNSYWYGAGLWALPIDAATQVACYRPDLLPPLSSAPPATFDDVLQLAARARTKGQFVIVPACPIDAISLVFTLSANLGHPITEMDDSFLDPRGCPRGSGAAACAHRRCPSEKRRLQPDPGLRFHGFVVRRGLLSLGLWLFQLLAAWNSSAVEIYRRSRCGKYRLRGNHDRWHRRSRYSILRAS